MFKFFRRVRQNLLLTNRLTKYLLYASGEIILVMIGILLALQINNWNEQRKLDETTKILLRQIQLDILNNIKVNNQVYRVYNSRDSIFWTMRQKKLKPSDFAGEKGRGYRGVIFSTFKFEMLNKGYEQLKIHPGIKPGDYTDLLEELEALERDRFYFNLNIQRMIDERDAHFTYRRANFDWFSSELWTGERSKDELEYYANDPILKNYMAFIIHTMGQAVIAGERYTFFGLKLYRYIAELLGQKEDELPEEIRNYYADIPSDSLTPFTGSYVLHYAPPLNSADRFTDLDSIIISISEKDELKLKNYREGEVFERDLFIRSINKLEEIRWARRIYYSINDDGYLEIKDYIGRPYLYRKL
ncbi:MAG: DUF6090 family protein [Flavobacteriaceae bacterium]|nr:DUF6090 family protein [Flavobacteriaceae bacterium]